jgi:hypothetical protein
MNVKPSATAVQALWMLAIGVVIIGSLYPGNSWLMRGVDRLGIWDKALHFVAYFFLATLPVLGFQGKTGALWAGSMALLGLLLEFAQNFAPGRSPEFADELANITGVACGILFGLSLRAALRTSASRTNQSLQ